MKVSALKREALTIEIVDRILYEGLEDKGDTGDCIITLGSRKAPKYRIPKAAAMYHAERAPKILLSGGKIIDSEFGMLSEAQIMKHKALELGVPAEDILLEELSLTTKENMICSLLTLERAFTLSKLRKILLVTTSYHMRRCLLMAQAYMPDWIEFSPCPAEDVNTRRDTWHQNEKGYQRAVDEACKIISYINENSIPDFII